MPSSRQRRQLARWRRPRCLPGEGADVHLVDHLALARDARATRVGPGEGVRVDRPPTARAGPRAGSATPDRGRAGPPSSRNAYRVAGADDGDPAGVVPAGLRVERHPLGRRISTSTLRDPAAPTRGSARRPSGASSAPTGRRRHAGGELLRCRTDGPGRNFHTRRDETRSSAKPRACSLLPEASRMCGLGANERRHGVVAATP